MHLAALQTVLTDAAVRDTVASVLAQRAYDRSLRDTLWNRITTWVGALFDRLNEAAAGSPIVFWSTRVLLATLVVALVARVAYVAWVHWSQREDSPSRGGRRMRGPATAIDALARAESEAAAGHYTEAAHLLYRALLETLAHTERLRLHPSKTVGDYARELRARSSRALQPFREFGRSYEVVIYDLQHCDQDRYQRLLSLATPLVHGHG